MNKRLIICADGTWNKPGQRDRGKVKPSNVVKTARSILLGASDGRQQIVFYDEGVGTDGSKLHRMIAGGTGLGLLKNIIVVV